MGRASLRALILDLDGTLVDSIPGICATHRAALAYVGWEPVLDTSIVPLIGLSLTSVARALLPDATGDLVQRYVAAYRRLHDEIALPGMVAFPGVPETLAHCREAGLTLIVATGKFTDAAEQVLRHCALRNSIDEVLGSDLVANPKPAPDLALAACARARVAPEHALCVGDAIHDIAMGQAAGMPTCGIATGSATYAQLVSAGADVVLERFAEVLGVLGL